MFPISPTIVHEMWYETGCILNNANSVKSITDWQEEQAMREAHENNNICIVLLDEDTAAVIIDSVKCLEKITILLADFTCKLTSVNPIR